MCEVWTEFDWQSQAKLWLNEPISTIVTPAEQTHAKNPYTQHNTTIWQTGSVTDTKSQMDGLNGLKWRGLVFHIRCTYLLREKQAKKQNSMEFKAKCLGKYVTIRQNKTSRMLYKNAWELSVFSERKCKEKVDRKTGLETITGDWRSNLKTARTSQKTVLPYWRQQSLNVV
jgi:hypothetical protein